MNRKIAFAANEIERLIAGPTLPLLWEKMCALWTDDWWRTDNEHKFEEAYIERESLTAELEKVVLETCDAAYAEIAQGVAALGSLQNEIAERRLVVVLDGLSLREACFLQSQLHERGYHSDLSYSFSALPADTEAFCQKHFRVPSLSALDDRTFRGFPAVYCPDENSLNIPTASGALIAVGLPDPLFHHGRRGRTQVVSLKSAYTRTWDACKTLLEAGRGREIWITTDHGYIYTGKNYNDLWWSLGNSGMGKHLGEIFRGARVVESGKISDAQRQEWFDYVFCNSSQCFVKGRWLWLSGGAGEAITHGGMSLIENLVPMLKITSQERE